MERQRSESRSQTESIMDAIRALHSGPPPSVQPPPPLPVPERLLAKADTELRYRMRSEEQISRSLQFDHPKRRSEDSSLPPSQRPDVKSTPKVSQRPMAPTLAISPIGPEPTIDPPDTAASFFAARDGAVGAGADDPGGSTPGVN
jgi:hypothetical protein